MTSALTHFPPMNFFQLVSDVWTEPFWTATASHRLEVPRCGDCGRFQMPPAPFCPSCQSDRHEWVEVDGRGTIYSYTLITVAPFPEAAAHLPYAPALIELDDAPGARIISAIVGAPISVIRIGARVKLCWQDLPDGVVIPRFELE